MKWLRSQFRTFVAIYRWWRTRFTPGGQAMSLAILLSVPWLFSSQSALLLVCAPLATLLLATAVANVLLRPRLNVRLAGEPLMKCGEPAVLRLRLQNVGRLPALDVCLQLAALRDTWEVRQSPAPIALAAGESGEVEFVVTPLRRGRFSVPELRVASGFPLNLVHFWKPQRVVGEIAVAPSYRPLRQFDAQALGTTLLDAQSEETLVAIDGGEYVGNRDHVPGQPVRRFDYAAWARLQRPIVREYRDAPHGRAVIVVDNFSLKEPHRDRAAHKAFEAALSLTAALAEALIEHGFELDLWYAPPSDEDAVLRRVSVRDVHYALAGAQLHPPDRFTTLLDDVSQHIGGAQTVFVVCHAWDDAREELCFAAGLGGAQVLPLIVGADAAPTNADARTFDVATIAAGEVVLP